MASVLMHVPFDCGAISTAYLQPIADILARLVQGNRFWAILTVLIVIRGVCIIIAFSLLVALWLKILLRFLAEPLEDTRLRILGLALETVISVTVAIIPSIAILWCAYGVISLAFGIIAGWIVVIAPIATVIVNLIRVFI